MVFRRGLLLVIVFCFYFFSSLSGQKDNRHFMQEGFQSPPSYARPHVYHWWLGGYVDTLRLKEEIQAMHKAGISGFTIFEIGSRDTVHVKAGPEFLGEQSLENIRVAVKEAEKLGMVVGLNTASSWNAGGKWIPPQHAAKSIYYSKQTTDGGKKIELKLGFPDIPQKDPWGKPTLIEFADNGKPAFYQEIAVLAIPVRKASTKLDTADIIDVTTFFDPKKELLTWNAPPGEWDIVRYVCSNSGENLILPSKNSVGPIVDHFDAEATEFHFLYIINKLQSVLGDLSSSALQSLYMASYEAKGFTWTTSLPAAFREIHGYDVVKFLPVIFDKEIFSTEVTAQFKADFQKVLSELMINNFYIKSKDICNAYGLKNNSEAGGPGLPLHNVPVDPIKALGAGLDIPRGEFWINHSRFNDQGIDILRVVKEVSSASHIYGNGIVEMEAFTTFQHWQEGPFEMKPIGDRAFAEGMNKVVVHGFTHNPEGTGFPGIVYHAGTHFNDKRVWWPMVKPFNEYLSRISFVLQEADFYADVLYYYGDTIPNFGGHKNSRFTVGPGYDYEIINTDILLELTVKDNKLINTRTGAEFKMLVLADEYGINADVLLKLNNLVKQGAVITGSRPHKLNNHHNRNLSELEGIIDDLWQDENSSNKRKRSIISDTKPAQLLAEMNVVPDINYVDKDFHTIDYTHYAKDDVHFYFICNTTDGWVSRNIGFRQQNKGPELWDPVTGSIVTIPVYQQEGDYITMPITLAPYGSTFVVFSERDKVPDYKRIEASGSFPPMIQYEGQGFYFLEEGTYNATGEKQEVSFSDIKQVKNLDGPWEVFFPSRFGTPAKIIFPKLMSWTEHDDESIKYFSGIARYEKSFTFDGNTSLQGNQKYILDLGKFTNVGQVWINDQPLGISWCEPHSFDISSFLRPGPNKLVVEIANTWSNRLVGDAVSGENYTSTNITSTDVINGFQIKAPWAEVPLIDSGLFGPVTITTTKVYK